MSEQPKSPGPEVTAEGGPPAATGQLTQSPQITEEQRSTALGILRALPLPIDKDRPTKERGDGVVWRPNFSADQLSTMSRDLGIAPYTLQFVSAPLASRIKQADAAELDKKPDLDKTKLETMLDEMTGLLLTAEKKRDKENPFHKALHNTEVLHRLWVLSLNQKTGGTLSSKQDQKALEMNHTKVEEILPTLKVLLGQLLEKGFAPERLAEDIIACLFHDYEHTGRTQRIAFQDVEVPTEGFTLENGALKLKAKAEKFERSDTQADDTIKKIPLIRITVAGKEVVLDESICQIEDDSVVLAADSNAWQIVELPGAGQKKEQEETGKKTIRFSSPYQLSRYSNEEVASAFATKYAMKKGLGLGQVLRVNELIMSSTFGQPERIKPGEMSERAVLLTLADMGNFIYPWEKYMQRTAQVIAELPGQSQKEKAFGRPKDLTSWIKGEMWFWDVFVRARCTQLRTASAARGEEQAQAPFWAKLDEQLKEKIDGLGAVLRNLTESTELTKEEKEKKRLLLQYVGPLFPEDKNYNLGEIKGLQRTVVPMDLRPPLDNPGLGTDSDLRTGFYDARNFAGKPTVFQIGALLPAMAERFGIGGFSFYTLEKGASGRPEVCGQYNFNKKLAYKAYSSFRRFLRQQRTSLEGEITTLPALAGMESTKLLARERIGNTNAFVINIQDVHELEERYQKGNRFFEGSNPYTVGPMLMIFLPSGRRNELGMPQGCLLQLLRLVPTPTHLQAIPVGEREKTEEFKTWMAEQQKKDLKPWSGEEVQRILQYLTPALGTGLIDIGLRWFMINSREDIDRNPMEDVVKKTNTYGGIDLHQDLEVLRQNYISGEITAEGIVSVLGQILGDMWGLYDTSNGRRPSFTVEGEKRYLPSSRLSKLVETTLTQIDEFIVSLQRSAKPLTQAEEQELQRALDEDMSNFQTKSRQEGNEDTLLLAKIQEKRKILADLPLARNGLTEEQVKQSRLAVLVKSQEQIIGTVTYIGERLSTNEEGKKVKSLPEREELIGSFQPLMQQAGKLLARIRLLSPDTADILKKDLGAKLKAQFEKMPLNQRQSQELLFQLSVVLGEAPEATTRLERSGRTGPVLEADEPPTEETQLLGRIVPREPNPDSEASSILAAPDSITPSGTRIFSRVTSFLKRPVGKVFEEIREGLKDRRTPPSTEARIAELEAENKMLRDELRRVRDHIDQILGKK